MSADAEIGKIIFWYFAESLTQAMVYIVHLIFNYDGKFLSSSY